MRSGDIMILPAPSTTLADAETQELFSTDTDQFGPRMVQGLGMHKFSLSFRHDEDVDIVLEKAVKPATQHAALVWTPVSTLDVNSAATEITSGGDHLIEMFDHFRVLAVGKATAQSIWIVSMCLIADRAASGSDGSFWGT